MRLVSNPWCAPFSGAPINLWNRRVRLVYLDESGTSNPEQEPVLVVAGVIVNADQDWLGLDRHLKSIMRKRLPEDLSTGIFHAKDIWHGEKKFYRAKWPLTKRMEIISDLAAIPAKFHPACDLRRYGPQRVRRSSKRRERARLTPQSTLSFTLPLSWVRLLALIPGWLIMRKMKLQ